MKILNFVPLLVWAVACAWIFDWSEVQRMKINAQTEERSAGDSLVFVVGCFVFILIGFYCS